MKFVWLTHARGGLLKAALRHHTRRLRDGRVVQFPPLWGLAEVIGKEEFAQEAYLFLCGWQGGRLIEEFGRKLKEVEAFDAREVTDFCRAARRHFREVAARWGYHRTKANGHRYQRTEATRPMYSAPRPADVQETLDFCPVDPDTARLECVMEMRSFCRETIMRGVPTERDGPRTEDGARRDWAAFQMVLAGGTLAEAARVAGWAMETYAGFRIRAIIAAIRQAAGVDTDIPLPDWRAGHCARPVTEEAETVVEPLGRTNGRATVAVDPSTPLKQIMKQFGVSKATASRIRERGWFYPNHPNRSR